MTDYDKMIDAEALAIIGRVFDNADLQQPAVIMTALVTPIEVHYPHPTNHFCLSWNVLLKVFVCDPI
jgi:hypothetical protein